MTSSFERHGIEHLSASSLNLWAAQPALWIMERLLGRRTPPGIPADRAAALRKAFDETMTDPDFVAEADKMKVEISPMNGQEVNAMLTELYATPKAAVEKAAKAMAP